VSVPANLIRELHEKAVQEAAWLALFHAQLLGWTDVQNQLTSVVAHVSEVRTAIRVEPKG
jgi:hypothetical protein